MPPCGKLNTGLTMDALAFAKLQKVGSRKAKAEKEDNKDNGRRTA
jgi:hypothetical protein